jgi:hypothetical protein
VAGFAQASTGSLVVMTNNAPRFQQSPGLAVVNLLTETFEAGLSGRQAR